MEFAEVIERARATRERFERYEHETYGRAWTLEELVLGLVGDVGDLAKLVQAREGIRVLENVDARLEHELADILWSVIVLADRCGVDLERAFVRTMDQIAATIGR